MMVELTAEEMEELRRSLSPICFV